VRPASEAERRRLNDTFARLCAIESPSGRERECADAVTAELRGMGVEVDEDATGNLLARIGGRVEPGVLLCAHLDTVALTAPIEPVIVEDGWENANDGILGADNKAAVAVILEVARRVSVEGSPVALEMLFTTGEEVALAGAKAFDVSRLGSRFGYVFDHASPIGEIVVASPTYFRMEAEFHGAAAHAGIRPEDGRSAIAAAARAVCSMQLGRLDERTTANVGTIRGGTGSTNVVPPNCRLEAEARSLDRDRVVEVITAMVDAVQDAANATECDVDCDTERLFDGYRTPGSAPVIAVAERALRACGHEPRHINTGGGSDANALIASGFTCANLANGTERNHQPDERVSVAALEGMLDVSLALLEEAAAEG
jgi:tripeptide aminopeptidase